MPSPDPLYEGKVKPRPCSGLTVVDGESLRHARPAGADLEMWPAYAIDYLSDDHGIAATAPMDLRPMLDVLAALYDGCKTCRDYHTRRVAAVPPLTVHVVGSKLLNYGIWRVHARLLMQHLDPDGAAVALTIRNEGLPAATQLADGMGPERLFQVARHALNELMPTAWLDTPVSNQCPPGVRRSTAPLGDEEMLQALRDDGIL